jgi:hypothetical protein
MPTDKDNTPSESSFFMSGSSSLAFPVYSLLREAMSIEKRYFTSDFSSLS